ncbi:MAG: gfo/Idh/MocA family oxidoreductase, partial [Planctomycetota bacterium]|nr:gfo/Idh/MocA family oxidoreductase [Planctomycetota bacterium]
GLTVSDPFSHVQAMSVCHLSAIAARLNRKLKWDPVTEKILGDDQAAAMQSRERREGYDILKV